MIHKVWFKNNWNWHCNSDLMIFDLLVPPQGPRGRGPKKWCWCMCHTCKKLVEFLKINFFTLPPTPKSHPWGVTQAAKWKSRPICLISFMCEKTHKVWLKNLWNWLCNWNLMILNYIWPFGPSPGGWGQNKMCRCPPHSCEQLTYQIWLDFVQLFRRR